MAIHNINQTQALKNLDKPKESKFSLYLTACLILTNVLTIAYIWLK